MPSALHLPMQIVQLTPGTGNFHCGNCIRDNTLARALRRIGHDVTMVPLYLPQVTDHQHQADDDDVPVFLGGVNVYLQHKSALFRHTPRFVDRLLDSRKILNWAANRSDMTSARDLGELTVTMLRGEEGTQNKELSRLIDWLRRRPHPDVVCLSNALLVGLARRIRSELNTRIVCTMAGEDGFLDSLAEPYRAQAWALLRERLDDVDHFTPVSNYYGSVMRDRLGLADDRMTAIYNGIELAGYEPADTPPDPPVIGYLARMHPAKGLATLVDAYIELRNRDRIPNARLRIVGAATPGDDSFVDQLRQRLADAGVANDVSFHPNVSLEEKQQLLRGMSVLSVPATYGEAFGLYVLEALASGVPVVQPRHAVFPELLERTGGGILCEPDDPTALCEALESVLLDAEASRADAREARARIASDFSDDAMANRAAAVFESVLDRSSAESPRS